MACLSDIRPPGIGDGPDPTSESQARSQIAAMAAAHGQDAWASSSRVELTMTDTWQGLATMFNPWPDNIMRGHIIQVPGAFDSRVDSSKERSRARAEASRAASPTALTRMARSRSTKTTTSPLCCPQFSTSSTCRFASAKRQLFGPGATRRSRARCTTSSSPPGAPSKPTSTSTSMCSTSSPTPICSPRPSSPSANKWRVLSSASHLEDRLLTDGVLVPRTVTITPSPADPTDKGWTHEIKVERLRFIP